MSACRHCGQTRPLQSRGLCWGCYGKPKVRDLYPSGGCGDGQGEPTQEEVDRMVAEGLANLPDWWQRDAEKQTQPWEAPFIRLAARGSRKLSGKRQPM